VLIPNDPTLANTTHYSQFVFVSAGANALGVFTTHGSANRVGGPIGVTRIHASGNPGATSGTLGLQYGMAIGLN